MVTRPSHHTHLSVSLNSPNQSPIHPLPPPPSQDTIRARTHAIARQARSAGVRHVMNLGHGVLPTTPEDHVGAFFEAAKEFRY